MTADDIPLGMRLKEQASWNQLPADWQRFLGLQPEGCFVAQWDGLPVATTITCVFGEVGWIAMVLVDESYRHRGIATRMVQHALGYLDERSVTTVRLDATRFGQPVYERMGFTVQHQLVRLQGNCRDGRRAVDLAACRSEDLDSLVALDQTATKTDRRRLFERLVAEHPAQVRLAWQDATLAGYVMLRPGIHATQIGPAVAINERAGRTLCEWAAGQCDGQPVFVDVPLGNHAAIAWAQSQGLVEQRRFARMYRGLRVDEDPELLWCSSGPEKG
jgi:GNAT superfamily N-acetyltransferase